MTGNESQLWEALEVLRGTTRQFVLDTRTPFPSAEARLAPLVKVIEALGQDRPAKPPVCPDTYRAQWRDYLDGRRGNLETRAVRFLCWESDIATDKRFHDYLGSNGSDLRSRALQGLVHSCHGRWSKALFDSGIPPRIGARIRQFASANRIIRRWQSASGTILGPQGPLLFADQLLRSRIPVKDLCKEWAIDHQAKYVLEAVTAAAEAWRRAGTSSEGGAEYIFQEVVLWEGWPLDEFKEQIGRAINHTAAENGTSSIEILKRLILSDARLRDPRLPANKNNWAGVATEARDLFISWLSAADIEFFFEHVLPSGADPHGRKKFWLRYVGQLKRSRPLLCDEDLARLRVTMPSWQEHAGSYGRISGVTSAFLLDFGALLVVEFSRVGNACYAYERTHVRSIVPDFWKRSPFSPQTYSGLKQPHLAALRKSRIGSWEWDVQRFLARYNIFPSGVFR